MLGQVQLTQQEQWQARLCVMNELGKAQPAEEHTCPLASFLSRWKVMTSSAGTAAPGPSTRGRLANGSIGGRTAAAAAVQAVSAVRRWQVGDGGVAVSGY